MRRSIGGRRSGLRAAFFTQKAGQGREIRCSWRRGPGVDQEGRGGENVAAGLETGHGWDQGCLGLDLVPELDLGLESCDR